jgi:NMD protein affecting ribosome stability and mRNA decay
MKDEIRVEFNMEQKMCSDCKKSSSEYYELKLQLRFNYFNNVDNIKKEIFNLIINKFNKINKFEEINNGFDFYFRDHGEMNKIAHLFNKRYFIEEKRSRKIIGHDFLKTKDIWRYTQLISIINLNIEDIISIKGENYYVKAFNKNDLVLRKLDTGAKKVVSYSIVKDYLKILDKKIKK